MGGFGESGGETGAHIFHTSDGETFERVHTENTTGKESLMTVRMLSQTEYWAGGATSAGDLFEFGGSNPPAPTPAPVPGAPHYEKPPCQEGEAKASVTDTDGSLCAPPCDASGSCPTDVPGGVTASPQCALKDTTGNQFCALICQADDDCDTTGGSKCEHP